ncbi:Uncharacterised protein [Fluoribacter dumoffii]|uniref:RING-type E3 ubiquitin transferase n=1 Tax=Fluoribacter dumoffii TaxID=463 RepID=A0A377G6H2_9GAMM|nr:hypothetical protein Ldum_0371 [Fluoribacter dumoffii NY 23]STO20412.1 Uncharacterised protein [Fluoribacter dumoffii]
MHLRHNLILAVTAIYLIVDFAYRKISKFFLAQRVTKINKAQAGVQTLKGKVQKFDAFILAPLSQKSCCGYLYFVVDKFDDIDKIVYSENQGQDFILDDGTGRCLIRSSLAGNFYNTKLWPPTIRFSNYSNLEDAIKFDDLNKNPSNKRYRHMEYRRQEEEMLYVEGVYQRTIGNLDLALLSLDGVLEDTNSAALTITPAYSGSEVNSSNRGYTLVKILNLFGF